MNILRTISLMALGLVFAVSVHAQTQNYVPNTLLGASTQNSDGAGASITTGDRNVFVGDSAGRNSTFGSDNVHVGYRAGFYYLSSASDNTFIGSQSGVGDYDGNATGFDNTFVGARSGFNNDATDNTFIGSEAGYTNTLGFDNTFVGETSGYRNTDGDDNTFIGEDAGYNNTTASDNTFIGSAAGRTNTTGYRNTAVGTNAGYDFNDGYKNTAVGDSAGVDIGAGHHNTMIGQAAGAATEHADYNTFVGAWAGWDNNRTNETNNANRNTYLGAYAGDANREGSDNVFIGYDANFRGIGYSGNNQNVVIGASSRFGAGGTGGSNYGVLIGAGAYADKDFVTGVGYRNKITGVRSVTLGAYDTITQADAVSIGYHSRVRAQYGISIGKDAAADSINSIAIGYQAKVTSSNEVSIGNATTGIIGGYVNWSATSDGRFKTNVEENVVGLDFIDALRPVTYNYDLITMEAFYGREIPEELEKAALNKSQVQYSGFIAQEVEAAAKSLGYDFSGVKAPSGEKDAYALRYAEFVIPLVKAAQELHQKVKDHESTIHQQQELLSKYENILEEMNSRMMVLEAKVASEHPDNYIAFRK